MQKWTVIVDDDCGTIKVYFVEARSPNQAAAIASRIYNEHASVGGRVQFVLNGEQVLEQFEGARMPSPIRLYLTEEEGDHLMQGWTVIVEDRDHVPTIYYVQAPTGDEAGRHAVKIRHAHGRTGDYFKARWVFKGKPDFHESGDRDIGYVPKIISLVMEPT